MKTINIILKVVLTLLLVSPILGVLGVFPEPTREMYTNDAAFQFINILMTSGYIVWMEALTFAVAAFCIWTRREALGALLLLPFTFNIVGFHAFLDGGLFTGGAIMGNILLLINAYFLWVYRDQIVPLLRKRV
ncbi:MAG: hypothetical protein KBB54_01800 [Candidatus Pacebacteria bacterium]|nr:hypothetical protein [Candidatus Paceibacterota bacterium]MBP9818982.1 hypothetical protein [Candidatus Paceibacterota bacterium]